MHIEIQKKIEGCLAGNPLFDQENSRRAVLINAGLDDELKSLISFSGPTFVFLTNLIELLSSYGKLKDGRDSLEAFLISSKDFVGNDKKEVIDKILEEWRSEYKNQKIYPKSIEKYLNFLINRWDNLESPLLPIDRRLSDIAINIKLYSISSDSDVRIRDWISKYKSIFSISEEKHSLDVLLRKMPEVRKWAIIGDPGTGKTTLLYQEASMLAKEALIRDEKPIPFFISLSKFSQNYENNLGYSIFDYIESVGKNLSIKDLGANVYNLCQNGKLIFFFDGLDEVSDILKESILENIEGSVFYNLNNRALITSRKVGFNVIPDCFTFEIAPLSINDQKKIMIKICGETKTKRLLPEMTSREDIRDMARIPMMLTVLSLVARESEDFSSDYFRRHSSLFKFASIILLEGRHRKKRGVRDPYCAELVMSYLSLQLHSKIMKFQGSEVFKLDEIERILNNLNNKLLSPWDNPRIFIEDISLNSNIIYPTDTLAQNYKYIHRTFREFFAALELSRWEKEERKKFVESIFFDRSWLEILVLLGGLVDDVNDYINLLLKGPPDLALRTLKEVEKLDKTQATKVLQLKPTRIKDRKEVFTSFVKKLKKKDSIIDVLWAYLESCKEDIPRVDLYFIQQILIWCNVRNADNLLADIFKYLPVVPEDLFLYCNCMEEYLPYWCDVEEGNCLIGSSLDDSDTRAWVPETIEVFITMFKIGRVPITNEVYELFDPKHYGLRDFQNNVDPSELNHHPVIRVSWYEAEIFCQWVSQKYSDVRLPTEYEWEKAASWDGETNLRFPWGNKWMPDYLNSWERGPNRTTQVGLYPEGASPFDVLDMAGNVWEWCLDWYNDDAEDNYENLKENIVNPIGPVYGKRRIDRGGGWYHDVGKPCTFLRAADHPGDTFSHCGFRIVESKIKQDSNYELIYELNKINQNEEKNMEKTVSIDFKRVINRFLKIISQ